ncbi:GATA transcription factor [Quillaja saponaria]|uniref:GATA transcription factor n=1 Tax=Quillaja saponaria TaxID=32244 RepID=A0AAD7LHV8_QUISA|nr:GATA transcription factor [Quillaja saponaria]
MKIGTQITLLNSTNNNTATRVCSDCNTTTTPLWRSGPRGPKSLCNACGIRQRKARRAMAEAACSGRKRCSRDHRCIIIIIYKE